MAGNARVWLMNLLVMAGISTAHGYGSGAPSSICTTMLPGHGTEQTAANPYTVTADANTYMSGTPVQVTISGTFRGLLIQARAVGSTDPVGTFSDPGSTSNLKLLDCGSAAGSAVTHANTNAKTDSMLTWNPPATPAGNIEFVATVAQAKDTWWLMSKSSALAAASSPTTDGGATSAPPARTTGTAAPQTTDGGNPNTATSIAHGSSIFCTISLLLTIVWAMRV